MSEATELEIRPENLVWIFGAGRTGSTWLMKMMGSLERYSYWNEPMVGELFGSFYSNAPEYKVASETYILGAPYREGWMRSIRNFVLDGARLRFPGLTPRRYLVIKDSNASIGAPLLVEALPESRLVLLVRDPRDVVASHMDASKKGSWMQRNVGDPEYEAEVAGAVERQPDRFVEGAAELLTKNMVGAKGAYDRHRGPKALVRYEELVADTLGTLRHIFDALGLPADEEELGRVVEEHSWKNVPEHEKGEKRFFRKATPGSWREDLTPEQAEIVERIAAQIFDGFYPDQRR